MRKIFTTAMLLVMALSLLVFVPAATANTTAKANHDRIDINLNYSGSTVSVSGETVEGADLVITIASPYGNETMKEKEKAGGFLWMNGKTIEFTDVPDIYFLRSPKPVEELLTQDEMNKYEIGYSAIVANAGIEPDVDAARKTELFNEFFRLKESDSYYGVTTGDIDMKGGSPQQEYYTVFDWPYQAPPGEYDITVYAVKDGKVLETADANLVVEEVGVEKTLTDMAMERGGLYGIAAIIVAVSAGFGVGVIFKTGGGAH